MATERTRSLFIVAQFVGLGMVAVLVAYIWRHIP